MDNVIPFVKGEVDVLKDATVWKMMREYYTCGVFRTMCHPDHQWRTSHAEMLVAHVDELAPYGTHCPIELTRTPMSAGVLGPDLFNLLHNESLAQRAQRIISVAWFHNLEVSAGTLSMLLGAPHNRMKPEIAEVIFQLVKHDALTCTDRVIEQPFKPMGEAFYK